MIFFCNVYPCAKDIVHAVYARFEDFRTFQYIFLSDVKVFVF